MTLYELVYSVIEQVERERGNYGGKEEVEEKVSYILKHSSMKYNSFCLRLESYTSLGIENWKDAELQLPKYLLFRITYDSKDWVLKSHNDLKMLEFDLRNSDDTIQVVLMDGSIKEYMIVNDIFNGLIVWKHPIYQIEYKEQCEDKVVLIYDNKQLEEKVRQVVKEGYEDIQVFNIGLGMYEHFYVKDVVYSTDGGDRPSEVVWGKSEMTFLDLANDEEEDIW